MVNPEHIFSLVQLIERAQDGIAEAQRQESEFPPSIADKLIAAHELLQVAKLEFSRGIPCSIELYKRCKTSSEILLAVEECCEKSWYQAYLHDLYFGRFDDEDPEGDGFCPMDSTVARRLEAQYGKEALSLLDSFDYGVLSGKATALSWVLGRCELDV